MTQNLNHYEKILSRSHSNYLAQISIEMTDANNQINDVLSCVEPSPREVVLIARSASSQPWVRC